MCWYDFIDTLNLLPSVAKQWASTYTKSTGLPYIQATSQDVYSLVFEQAGWALRSLRPMEYSSPMAHAVNKECRPPPLANLSRVVRLTRRPKVVAASDSELYPMRASASAMQIGVGTSMLQYDMVVDGGYQHILNTDISETVVNYLQQQHKDIPKLQYILSDARYGRWVIDH